MSTLVSQLSKFPSCSPLHAVWQVNTWNENGMTMRAEIGELNLFQVGELLLPE
jgi:hypothetical protein